ncbi:MAG: aminotransferase class III-fold pyridoxal phosphate-dependent enzyme [Candidatus Eisenbacteria bacterium]
MNHLLRTHEILDADFVRGENCSLFDRGGRRFVDFESGIWSTVLGHGHPAVTQALQAQAAELVHLGTRFPSRIAEAAARDVLEVTGLGDGACVFLSSGSEAVEFAAQAARHVTGRDLLLTLRTSYLAALGSAGAKRPAEWCLVDGVGANPLDPDEVLREVPFERIGAFVFEAGGSSPGFVRFPQAPVVDAIARRVREHGGLLVCNEVTTGMGRTGRWFGFEHHALAPDAVALGKGLGNGYPVSAVAMRRAFATRLERTGLYYAQSHQNDPLGCAVARAVIAALREGGWVERGAALGRDFLADLQRLAARHACVAEARGRGMLLALELDPAGGRTAEAVFRELYARGFLVNYYPAGHLLRFDPALTMPEADVQALLGVLDEVLRGRAA